MTPREHDRAWKEPRLSVERPGDVPRPQKHYPWSKLREQVLNRMEQGAKRPPLDADTFMEGYEAGYRRAISDLEAFWQDLEPGPSAGVGIAIDLLMIRVDDYWPQEEIT